MDQWFRLAIFDPFVVSGTCAVLMLICLKAGYGRRRKEPGTGKHGSALIDEASLAILGLLLAFSFAAAYSKLDTRNSKIVDDANALRTLYFRCQLLPEPQREQLQALVIDSIRQRLVLCHSRPNAEGLLQLDVRIRATEGQMVTAIRRVGQEAQTAELAAGLMDACDAAVSAHEARIAAASDHVPLPVIILQVLVAAISAYLLGRSEGESGRLRRRNFTLIIVVSAIMHVTLDLEQPLRGFIQSNQEPIVRLASSLNVSS